MEDKALAWDKDTEAKFNLMINKMPLFHRRIAESVAKAAAEENARKRNSKLVQEEDVVRAFFSEVPTPFYSMMIKLFEDVGFDYRKYQQST